MDDNDLCCPLSKPFTHSSGDLGDFGDLLFFIEFGESNDDAGLLDCFICRALSSECFTDSASSLLASTPAGERDLSGVFDRVFSVSLSAFGDGDGPLPGVLARDLSGVFDSAFPDGVPERDLSDVFNSCSASRWDGVADREVSEDFSGVFMLCSMFSGAFL